MDISSHISFQFDLQWINISLLHTPSTCHKLQNQPINQTQATGPEQHSTTPQHA
ncbi:hypothetical protein E2C01_101157 [Portunus trituberculatus]|uniref:Uncharacterized protein n=1 Tax=Portunus trituberculatus TaxID=210409 RepID=A0A5B7KFE3_PORTR|nr:hypothetical protein [Portunus trituberculatus]